MHCYSPSGGCSMAMGMANYDISDDQISASSYSDNDHLPQHGRLLSDSYWMPNPTDTDPWIQISFEQQIIISGVIIDATLSRQGAGWIWVDTFYLTYSDDGMIWKPYVYFTKSDKVMGIQIMF